MNWDPFQREALAELGLRVYRMRGEGASVRAVETSAPPPAVPGARPDPLLRALVRAAGTDALPELEMDALRRDPAAKRALWPRLRALRASARSR